MNDAPDFQAATQTQQEMWSKGDFAMVANSSTTMPRPLPKRSGSSPASASSTSPAAAATEPSPRPGAPGATPAGADFVPALLERGRERAKAERLEIEFVEADAQDLPFGDGEFDVTISIFGAMFAPDHAKTASELLRVTKPGGRIGMANWCPDGGLEGLFMTIVKHTAGPPPGTMPPVLWGSEDHVRELFGDGVSELSTQRLRSRQPFYSADQYIEFFRSYFGPIQAAFEKVGPEGEEALANDLRTWLEGANVAGDRALVIEPEYLQVIATKL